MATNRRQHRTSLKDLACELGVSIATVSRALRSSPEIGKDMQQRVKALAKQLNYRPNPFAQSLRREAPKMIGVVVPNLVTHYYAAVLDGIEDAAHAAGYSVISANSHEDVTAEAQAIDNFINLHVEGIIACLAQTTTDDTKAKKSKAMAAYEINKCIAMRSAMGYHNTREINALLRQVNGIKPTNDAQQARFYRQMEEKFL